MPLATAQNIARDIQVAVIKRRTNQEETDMNDSQLIGTAIREANQAAHEAGLPTYSELVEILRYASQDMKEARAMHERKAPGIGILAASIGWADKLLARIPA